MDGLLVIDKPSGPTSHDVVARVRRALRERRVGHTGTLDPLATGVLPLVVGRATRLARFLTASDKAYDAVIALGLATDTGDALGQPIGEPAEGPWPSREAIESALDAFRGTRLQQPPAFSAKKIGGHRSHRIARRGRLRSPLEPLAPLAPLEPLALPVSVTVHALDLVSIDGGRVSIRLDCSAGFYVRALAHELGERLGLGAHLLALRRTRSGDLTLGDAVALDAVEHDAALAARALVPLSRMLPALPAMTLSPEGVERAVHGQDLRPRDTTRGVAAEGTGLPVAPFVRLVDAEGQLVGMAEPSRTPGFLHPLVVLV